jgi:DNA-binding CsgD family transcriptional regulator
MAAMVATSALGKETAEILRVIEQPTAALTNRDADSYERAYLHAPYIRRMGGWSHGDGNWTEGGVFVQEGWDQVWPSARQFFEEWPYAVYPHGTHCTNWSLRVGRDMAWATFDQYPLDADGRRSPDVVGFLRETRMLEKHSGQWKLAYVGFFHELPSRTEQPVVRVDADAAIVAMSGNAAARIDNSETLQVRHGRLGAADRDTDLRLRSTIREIARANPWTIGTQRIPFVLRTPWGATDCVCWIAASLDMKANAMVALDDTGTSRRRLQSAALAYRLSPAQTRLAEKIVEGHDLGSAAERLGVTVNTARTHLYRMFDKTGARSQPALIKALLSVTAPAE